MALPAHRTRRRPMLRGLFSSSRHDRHRHRLLECRSAPRLHLAGDKCPRPRPALDEFPPSSPDVVLHQDVARRGSLVQRLRRPAASRPRHPEFVISEGVENLFLRERVLSEGDLTPRAPEPDIRRRASAASNEVRAARARVAHAVHSVTRSRHSVDEDDADADEASFTSQRCMEVQSCRKLHFSHRCATCPTDDELLRRAQGRGAVAEPLVAQLRALRAQRAAYERGYQDELARLAHLVDALPVHVHDATCVIDLAKIQAGELVIRLPCMCVFHQRCLLEYFDTLEHPRCPVDRTPIPKSVIPYLPCWRWGEA